MREERLFKDVCHQLGATPVANPLWTHLHQPATTHNLGGCCMADTPERGVVSSTGEVFGYPNLYVLDGAIIPTAIGANPSATIAAVGERSIEAIIRRIKNDPAWQAPEQRHVTPVHEPLDDVLLGAGLSTPAPRSSSIGLRFTETMRGTLAKGHTPAEEFLAAEKQGQRAGTQAEFTLTILIPELDLFISDPRLTAIATGTVRLDGFTGPEGRLSMPHLPETVGIKRGGYHLTGCPGSTKMKGWRNGCSVFPHRALPARSQAGRGRHGRRSPLMHLRSRSFNSSSRQFLLALLLLGPAGPARAQDSKPMDTTGPISNDALLRACQQTVACSNHLDRANELYKQNRYDAAIEEYLAAYILQPYPLFLYNVARLHHKQSHLSEAIAYYERYLGSPDNSQSERVKEYLSQAQQQLALEQRQPESVRVPAPAPAAALAAPPSAPSLPVAPAAPSAPSLPVVTAVRPARLPVYKKWWFWTLIGAAAAGAGTAIGLGVYGSGPDLSGVPVKPASLGR